ncbi:MAG: alpha/beta hydrolase [Desulfobacterales bacterium]
MGPISLKAGEGEWPEYYDRFAYFSPDAIRHGCHPRRLEHPAATEKAIVLVHGLSDSPYFLSAIADHFHRALGYNVYLPLLHGHGLQTPNGMEGVELEEWKANVGFAVTSAAAKAANVSIGGLSTGGALSFYTACTRPRINGGLYLFSAALDLTGGPLGLIGEMKERLLRTFLTEVLDRNQPLVGRNPYRYSRIDVDGARELARLIKETDDLLKGFDASNRFPNPVFACHSESDKTADIQGLRRLQQKSDPARFTLHLIPEEEGVPHASVVLEESIYALGAVPGEPPLEPANPRFGDLLVAISRFEKATWS